MLYVYIYTYICSTTNLNNFILDPTEETCVNTWEYDCSLYLSFCDNTEYAWFAEVCKKSCGKCGMQINFCDGINVNVKKISLWSFSRWINVFSILHLIDSHTCADNYNDCKDNAHLCSSNSAMRADCPKTCGDCKGSFNLRFIFCLM